MATTVSYKGSTIATVENNTKTLKTSGKYCEGDFILTDVSGGGGGVYQEKTLEFQKNTSQAIVPDEGYDAISKLNLTINTPTPGFRIGGDHVDANGKWHRPEGWDDIESIDVSGKCNELYMLYKCHTGGTAFMSLRPYGNGTLTWSFGHVSNGVYTYHSTCAGETTFANGGYIRKYLETLEDDYIVIRILSTSYISSCGTATWAANSEINAALPGNLNTMLMRYGRGAKMNSLSCLSYYLESDNIIDFAKDYQNATTTITVSSAYNADNSLKRVVMDGWDLSKNKITNLSYMFASCFSLVDLPDPLDMTGWATSNCTHLGSMFSGCQAIKSKLIVKNWDLTNVTSMASTFNGMMSVLEIEGTETWNSAPLCTNTSSMFATCHHLTSDLDVSNCYFGRGTKALTSVSNMFGTCYEVRKINMSNMDLSKCTNVSGLFSNSRALTTLIWDNVVPPSSVCTTTTSVFSYSCYPEIIIDGWDFSKNANGGFLSTFCNYSYGTKKIVFQNCITPTIAQNDSSTSTYAAFRYGYVLEYLDISFLDMRIYSNVNMHLYGFRDCQMLVDFYPPQHICKNFNLTNDNRLSHDSLIRVINNLDAVTTATTLTLGAFNLVKLTDEEKQVAIDKGWTLA